MQVKIIPQINGFFKKEKKRSKLIGALRVNTKLNILSVKVLKYINDDSVIFLCKTRNFSSKGEVHMIQVDKYSRVVTVGRKKRTQRQNYFDVSVLETSNLKNIEYSV